MYEAKNNTVNTKTIQYNNITNYCTINLIRMNYEGHFVKIIADAGDVRATGYS